MGVPQSFLALVFCLSVFSAIKTFSQVVNHSYVLHGIVQTEEDKTPIENAVVFQTRNGRILNFTTTKENGVFYLAVSTNEGDSSMLVIRSLGYEGYQVRISDIITHSLPLVFLLRASVKQLDEVIIYPREKVRSYNDTTTIIIKDVDPSVRTLERLLATLPDFQVNEDGSIYFKGKEISKIYLEGADLTSFNYKRLSKSMPADFIESIDIIEKFVENKLLGGLVWSDAVVLNLRIDPSRYGKMFGDARLSHGNQNYRDVGLNDFLIGGSYKGYAQFNHNNTGDRYDPHASEVFRKRKEEGFTALPSISPFLLTRAPVHSVNLANINNEAQAGITQVFSSAPDSLLITVDMSYLQDRLKPAFYDSLLVTVNPETDEKFYLSTNRLTDNRIRNFYFRNRYEWSFRPGQKLDVQYQLNSSRSTYLNSIHQNLFAYSIIESDIIREDFYTNVLQHNLRAEWTKRTGLTSAFQWVHFLSSCTVPQQLVLSSSLNRFPVPADTVVLDNLDQHITYRMIDYSNVARLFKAVNRSQYSIGAEMGVNKNSIYRQLRDRVSERDFMQTFFGNFYGGLSFEYNTFFRSIKWHNSIAYRFQQFRLNENAWMFLYPIIRSSLEWKLSSSNKLEINSQYDTQFPSASDVVGFQYVLNFNQFHMGLGEVVRRNHAAMDINYSLSIKPKFFDVITQFTVERYRPDYFNHMLLNQYVQIQQLQAGKSTSRVMGYFSISKFFYDISLRFTLSSSIASTSFYNLINNNEFRKNNVLRIHHKVSTGTGFNFPVNFYWDFSFIDLMATTNTNHTLFKSQNNYYQSKLTLKYYYKHVSLLIEHEHLMITGRRMDIVGFSLNYKVPDSWWEVFFYGRNLINNKNYTLIFQNDFSFTQTQYELLSAMVVAGVRLKF